MNAIIDEKHTIPKEAFGNGKMNLEALRQLARSVKATHISVLDQSIYRFSYDPKDYGWWRGFIENGRLTWRRWHNQYLPESSEPV